MLDFQTNYEEYLEDEIYIDITDPRIVVTPIRFDFDSRDEVAENIIHPVSHLTIGQYQNCRIPVARPLTPYQFISFIVRNFYNTAYKKYNDCLCPSADSFDVTITEEERRIIHIGLS